MKSIQVHCIGVAAERDICKPRQIKPTFSFVFGHLDELTLNDKLLDYVSMCFTCKTAPDVCILYGDCSNSS